MSRKFNGPAARFVFRLCQIIQQRSAYAQGKGYGTATIEREVRLMQNILGRKPKLAIDIGGNVGDYTAELLQGTPDVEVHIFEPSPLNIDKLTGRFSAANNVKVVPYGVSNSTGTATLYSNKPGSGLSSLTKRKLPHFNINFDHTDTVKIVRFEDYWKEQLKCRRIDIVKIDIEGHELPALEGFGEAIRAVGVLQFEFGGCNIDTRTYFRDFWYFFRDIDFDIYRITPFGLESIDRYRESDEIFSVTNFIAANAQPTG
jgi:FkbM family methyltransferase